MQVCVLSNRLQLSTKGRITAMNRTEDVVIHHLYVYLLMRHSPEPHCDYCTYLLCMHVGPLHTDGHALLLLRDLAANAIILSWLVRIYLQQVSFCFVYYETIHETLGCFWGLVTLAAYARC